MSASRKIYYALKNNMTKRKILVFGASGEIGGRVARGCVEAGYKVTGISRGTNKRQAVDLFRVEMIHGDKRDENFIRDTVSRLDFDAVIDSVPNFDCFKIGPDRVPLELWGGQYIKFFKRLKAHLPVAILPCQHILLLSGSSSDLADAFVQALSHPEKVCGEIFIISCKRAITLGQYLQTAMEQLGSRSEIQTVSAGELMKIHPGIQWEFGPEFLLEHICFDISKAEGTFGYKPLKSTEYGLRDALQWCQEAGMLS